MNLWDSIRPYLVLFGIPLAFTVPGTIVVWLLLGQPLPESLVLPVAVLITPALWGGVLLAILIYAYERSARRSLQGGTNAGGRASVALRRLERAYAVREWLARTHLRSSVYIAYLLTFLRLRPAINSHPLNAYREGNEEYLQLRVRQQQALLGRISQFVYLTGSGTNPQAQEQLAVCIALLPPGVCQSKLHDIVAETSGDGPGVLSTLTALTYVHYLYSLPTPLGEEIETAVSLVQFNCVAFGWLSNRVLEAIVYMLMRQGLSALAISQRLQPVLDEVSRNLAAAQLPDAILASKWNGRALLRQEAGIEA